MSVPSAVDRQSHQADDLLDEFEKSLGTIGTEEVPPSEPEATPTPEPEAPPTTPTPEPQAASEGVEALRQRLEYERHRNDSLQGRVESQLRAANLESKQLREQMQKLQTPAQPVVPANRRHLTPEELANADGPTLDLQGRVAQGVAETEVERVRAELEARNTELQARLEALEQSREAEVVDTLWDSVERLSPGAKSINSSDPGWFKFLDSVDDASGRPRRDIGAAAAGVGDVKRLASLVAEYRESKGLPPGNPAVTAQVRPTARPGTPTPSQPKLPIFKESQIELFFNKLSRGAYKGREKEATELENQIYAAVQGGRTIAG